MNNLKAIIKSAFCLSNEGEEIKENNGYYDEDEEDDNDDSE